MHTTDNILSTDVGANVQFSRGIPPLESIPAATLSRLTETVAKEERDTVFQYAPLGRFQGNLELRKQLGIFHDVDPDTLFVGNGSLQVLDLLTAHLLSSANAHVFVEVPTYDRAAHIFERHGARVIGIPIESDGIDLRYLREQLQSHVPAFLYTIPDFQNPTGITMGVAKRRALVELAEEFGFTIVEDIPYRELRYHGVAAPMIRTSGAANVITVGSLSKVISPGLRIGYAICDPTTARSIASIAENTYLSPSPLCQAVAARCFATGLVKSNIEHIRNLLRPRHDAAIESVRRFMRCALLAVPNGGYFLGLRISTRADEETLLATAARAGITLTRGSGFYPQGASQPAGTLFLRIPFHAICGDEFAAGIERLGDVVTQLSV